jgi:hypothetical protein
VTFDILDSETLARVGMLDSFVSLLWVDAYYTLGEMTLEVQTTDENLALLTEGRWVRRSDSDIPMRICARRSSDDGKTLICTGAQANWILSKRVQQSAISGGNAEALMRQLAALATDWPRFELGEAIGFDTTYDNDLSCGSAFDLLSTIGQSCDLGFRVRLSGKNADKRLLFEVYRPTQDPNKRYAEAYNNLSDVTWAFGDSDYANVAFVEGAEATVLCGDTDTTGMERREMYVDATGEKPDSDETAESAAYLSRLMDKGYEKLLSHRRTGTISFTLSDDELDVGDVISASLPRLGYKATARVVEVELLAQLGKTTRTVSIGTPIWAKIQAR